MLDPSSLNYLECEKVESMGLDDPPERVARAAFFLCLPWKLEDGVTLLFPSGHIPRILLTN